MTKRQLQSICLTLAILLPPVAASAFVSFIDTAPAAGIHYSGQSWGAAWGDFNGDRWPDLWVSNHSFRPYLYLNNQDGSFTEISDSVLPDEIKLAYKGYDTHGAAWADYDNDGDQDLIQAADGGARKHANWLFENVNGQFINRAIDFGITAKATGSRVPTWYDWNNDGLLDLAITAALRSPTSPKSILFYNTGNGFTDVTASQGFNTSYGTTFTRAIDIDQNGSVDALLGSESGSAYAYDVSTQPFSSLSSSSGLSDLAFYKDSVFTDLNHDGNLDIYAVTGHAASDVVLADDFTVESRLSLHNEIKGFDVKTAGNITVSVYPKFKISRFNIFIGTDGIHPPASSFTLSPADIQNHGVRAVELLPSSYLTIGYLPDSQQWQIRYASTSTTAINLVLESDTAITNVTAFAIDPDEPAPPDLFMQGNGNTYSLSTLAGITAASSGRNIVAADFDNDTDEDLYIVSTGSVQNLPNILYENNGDGTYTAVPGAAGAAGNLLGRGDTVTTVDYNQDGFLDLFVTNGTSKPPYDADGPYWLFTNQGNSNNWLEVDLEGVYDNRDGIGARVVVSHQSMSQEKMQYNGTHYRAQNHARLHFGMAAHKRANVTVYWPDGQVQRVKNVPVNQILYIQQPGKTLQPGKPAYSPGSQDAVYVWRQYWDGPWQLRVNGSGSKHISQVKILSTDSLSSVNGNRLEANDRISSTANSISFDATVSIGEDGLSFNSAFNQPVIMAANWNNREQLSSILLGQNQLKQPASGWLFKASDLAAIPAFNPKTDAGLFAGQNNNSTGLSFRTSGASAPRLTSLDVLSSSVISAVLPVSVDPQDNFKTNQYSVQLSGWVGSGFDGFDISLNNPDSDMAVLYQQSGVNQYVNVNPGSPLPMPPGKPNAIRLPLPQINGKPVYDSLLDQGLYIWRDSATGRWHVRASTGNTGSSLIGHLSSSNGFVNYNTVKLEASDNVSATTAQQIDFNFELAANDEDGFSFSVDKNSTVSLTLDTANGRQLIKIGAQQWPVLSLPVRLQ